MESKLGSKTPCDNHPDREAKAILSLGGKIQNHCLECFMVSHTMFRLKELSAEEQKSREPLSPEVLASALQDDAQKESRLQELKIKLGAYNLPLNLLDGVKDEKSLLELITEFENRFARELGDAILAHIQHRDAVIQSFWKHFGFYVTERSRLFISVTAISAGEVKTAMTAEPILESLNHGVKGFLFFIDLCPQANWCHDCIYVFISEDGYTFVCRPKEEPPDSSIPLKRIHMAR